MAHGGVMRRVIDTSSYDWKMLEFLQRLLNVRRVPKFIIIETVEENE